MKKYFLSFFIFFFIFVTGANAGVRIDGNQFTNDYPLLYFNSGSHTFEFNGGYLSIGYDKNYEFQSYSVLMFCYNGESILNYNQTSNDSSISTTTKWSFINTNQSCIYTPGGATGKVLYVLSNKKFEFGSYSDVLLQGKTTFEIPGNGMTVWYFINEFHSNQPITFDYTTNTLITQNEEIKNQLQSQNEKIEQQIQQQQETNKELGDLNDNLTNSDAPDGMDSLGSASGWLPPGPVDSLLTLPLSMLNNISTSLGSTCKPINLPIPFVDKNLTMPCLNTIYSQISGLGVFLNSIGTIAAGFMLYYYFKKLYAYIDNLLSLKNNGEGWGDV